MALKDFEAFLRERALIWRPDEDVTAGSPFDTAVIQPTLGRIGTDPFSTNLPLFLRERVAQEFPELARSDAGALGDLFIKPAEIIMDPLTREINRVALVQSVSDPSLLTTEEAEAHMANLFAERNKGTKSKGVVRVYFSSPRSTSVNPGDYCLAKRGWIFNPKSVQSIRQDEMLLNVEGSLYYFDVDVEAEQAGDQYNIDPDQIISIANLTGVVKVINKRRFRSGTPAENAVEYIGRAEQELSEKSLVSLRGILSLINRNFNEVTRVAVVGHGDPEMDRDVIKGGGLGPTILTGSQLSGWSDGAYGTNTTRVKIDDADVDFRLLIGPVGATSGFALTMYGAFASGDDIIQDIGITRVVDTNILELENNNVLGAAQAIPWALRKRSITLGDIPGGILFPDGPNGTVEVLDDEVHIGGCTDLYIRSTGFSSDTLTLDAVADDEPAMSGTTAYYTNGYGGFAVVLTDIEFYDNTNPTTADYFLKDGDPTYEMLADMTANGYIFRVLSPSHNAGTYRVLRVLQDPANGKYPILLLDRAMTAPIGIANPLTWRVQDDVDVDLIDPKERKWEGADLRTYSGQQWIDTAAGTDFDALGVVAGDKVRISNGYDAGDYTVASAPTGAGYTKLELTEILTRNEGGLSFVVFRANVAGGITLPLIRISSVDLLDSGSEPVGSQIPYGNPVYCRSTAFQNSGHGTKLEVHDACVGIVGQVLADGTSGGPEAKVAGKSIRVEWYEYWTLREISYKRNKTITFYEVSLPSTGMLTLQEVVDQINVSLIAEVGVNVSAAHIVDDRRLGISPIGMYTEIWDGQYDSSTPLVTTGYHELFGVYTSDTSGLPGYKRWYPPMTSRDVRSDAISNVMTDPNPTDEWYDDQYDIDRDRDGLDLVDGAQSGSYGIAPLWHPLQPVQSGAVNYSHLRDQLDIKLTMLEDMNPETNLHIRVGARSIGNARLYFLEPVSIEFGRNSRFTVDDNGVEKVFFPAPSIHTSKIPGHPNTEEPKDAGLTTISGSVNTDYGYITSTTSDFYVSGVKVGDLVQIKYEELYGLEDLAADVANLAGTKIVMSVDNGPDIAVEFEETALSLVTRAEVAEQINDQLGMNIASIVTTAAGLNSIAFSADVSVVVRYKSGSSYGNTVLGLAVTADVSNDARCAGTYDIYDINSETVLKCRRHEGPHVWSHADTTHNLVPQHIAILRSGTQRFSSTLVNGNTTTAGLYYADIELASMGVGDDLNIDADMEMLVAGHLSYGYQLDAGNQELTFSMLEQPYLRLPPVYFPVGTSDEVQNAITVVGQNVQVTYDTTSIIDSVQDYVNNELDRVTNANILVRHLLPHFIMLDVTYAGGSKASLLQEDIESHIDGLFPNQPLQSDELIKVIKNRGASSVSSPLDIIAVVHSEDRSIWLDWSKDRINSGRLAAFFSTNIVLTRQTS